MTAVKQGLKAFRKPQGKMVAANPHQEGTQKHKDWEFGFNKAYFQNLEKVKKYEARRGS